METTKKRPKSKLLEAWQNSMDYSTGWTHSTSRSKLKILYFRLPSDKRFDECVFSLIERDPAVLDVLLLFTKGTSFYELTSDWTPLAEILDSWEQEVT